MQKARYATRLDDGRIRCDLCPHACRLIDGATGQCHVRTVRGEHLVAMAYGAVSSMGMEPMEKKPLYHFFPGVEILSVGSWGCNLACSFCQNWQISQSFAESGRVLSPDGLIQMAQERGCGFIAYTYNEPLIGVEFVYDSAVRARAAGIKNVLVTNGFIRELPARDLLPLIDAVNLDIKSMDDDFYREYCHGRLGPVLRFGATAVAAGCHLEVTNLLIPGLNDSDELVAALVDWIAENLGKRTPLHLSAYRPQYRMDRPATSIAALERAMCIAKQRLDYVYLGNVIGSQGSDTACPTCGALLVRRTGFHAERSGIENGRCSACQRPVDMSL